jgi:hypothetical protein
VLHRIGYPPIPGRPTRPPTAADIRRLVHAAEDRNPVFAALIMLAPLTLLRLHRDEVRQRASIGEVTVDPDAFVFSSRP